MRRSTSSRGTRQTSIRSRCPGRHSPRRARAALPRAGGPAVGDQHRSTAYQLRFEQPPPLGAQLRVSPVRLLCEIVNVRVPPADFDLAVTPYASTVGVPTTVTCPGPVPMSSPVFPLVSPLTPPGSQPA